MTDESTDNIMETAAGVAADAWEGMTLEKTRIEDTTTYKSCPFCGKTKKLYMKHISSKWYVGGLYAVYCGICGIRSPYALSKRRAIELWNRRKEQR